jgi:hypothetical protein
MMKPSTRAKIARIAVFISLIGWPITQFTVASGEPPFVLGLSWLALILTLLDIAATTDVREKAEEAKDDEIPD